MNKILSTTTIAALLLPLSAGVALAKNDKHEQNTAVPAPVTTEGVIHKKVAGTLTGTVLMGGETPEVKSVVTSSLKDGTPVYLTARKKQGDWSKVDEKKLNDGTATFTTPVSEGKWQFRAFFGQKKSNVTTFVIGKNKKKITIGDPNLSTTKTKSGAKTVITATVENATPRDSFALIGKNNKGWRSLESGKAKGNIVRFVTDKNLGTSARILGPRGAKSPILNLTSQAPISSYGFTSMCKPDANTAQFRIRNNSSVEQPYTLRQYGGGTVYIGTAPTGDSFRNVPWTNSGNTWILTIDGYNFTKAAGNNPICAPAAPTTTLNPVTVIVGQDGNRYFQVSGTTTGYNPASLEVWNTAVVRDNATGNPIEPIDSTVYLNSNGSYSHGTEWFAVPTVNGGTYTVTVTTGQGANQSTASRTVTVPAISGPTQTMATPSVWVGEDGNRYLQVSGTTTGYRIGAWSEVRAVTLSGAALSRDISSTYLDMENNGSYRHGEYWFGIPNEGGTYQITSTVGAYAMKTVETITVTVPARVDPTQTLNVNVVQEDGTRYVRISGTTTGYAGVPVFAVAYVTDENGNRVGPDQSAVWLEENGSFSHGDYFFPLPAGPGEYTVTSKIGTYAMETVRTRTINVN